MARGSSNNSDGKLFFINIRGLKKGEEAHMTQSEARGKGEYVELEEKIKSISGKLKNVEVREYEYEGEKVKELKIWLEDKHANIEGDAPINETYAIGVNFNSIGRSIANTLLGLDLSNPIGNLEIRVYNKKDENAYASVYVEYKGVKAGWKYSIDKQNEFVTTNEVRKGKTVKYEKDYTELNEFLEKELKEFVIPVFDKTPNKFKDNPQSNQASGKTAPPEGDGDNETNDLPF